MHEITALGTTKIADGANRVCRAHGATIAQHCRLLFGVATDALERRSVQPQAETFRAFVERDAVQIALEHGSLARRTKAFRIPAVPRRRRAAATGTELRALEHHLETRRARNGGEPRSAMAALGLVAGDRRATAVAVKRLRNHGTQRIARAARSFDSKLGRIFQATRARRSRSISSTAVQPGPGTSKRGFMARVV